MRDRSIDEFESIFERASIPVLDIREIALQRVAAVLEGGPLDGSILDLARHVQTRFSAAIRVHWDASLNGATLGETVSAAGLELHERSFGSIAELVGQVSIWRSQLLLLPLQDRGVAGDDELDALIRGAAPPVLIVRTPVTSATGVFRKVLHSLTGSFEQTQHFAYSFTLVEDTGSILLLHTVDTHDVAAVRAALRVSPDIADEGEAELLDSLAHHGERYLKGVGAASRNQPYDVSYRLAVGEVVPTVQAELERGEYGLLVVGTHEEGYSHVVAADYQLMHMVRDIPVLAL